MHFTQEDYKKIESWLYQRTVKDSMLPPTGPLNGSETIALIQDGENKSIGIADFINYLAALQAGDRYNIDIYNITAHRGETPETIGEAAVLVPISIKKLGLIITFCNKNKNWYMYQFTGPSVSEWDNSSNWRNLASATFGELSSNISNYPQLWFKI